MFLSRLYINNFRQYGEGENGLEISLNTGVTALIGRNDSGKTTIIDAIRFALLTRDQEFMRIQLEDFNIDQNGIQSTEISIRCIISGLNDEEKGAFAEYLTYKEDQVSLIVNWNAKRKNESQPTRRWVDISVRSGFSGTGPVFETSVRDLLSTTYLKPLRDAEKEMSPGRGSRLSQILANIPNIDQGDPFIETALPTDENTFRQLSLLGLADLMRYGVKNHSSITNAQNSINGNYLSFLSLAGDNFQGEINISEGGTDSARLRQILERLELGLFESTSGKQRGRYGLGSNNLLYIACELLLLGREPEGLPLLLVEEPEAHLHPQRQLRLMEFLSKVSTVSIEENENHPVQVILSTHSPNLASKIPLENIVLVDKGKAFSLSSDQTLLSSSDYRFLERFLDVTKANLFFAHGIIIVEGDAEAILLPTIGKLLGIDFTENGISIVNVGGIGLRRYSKIFQRRSEESHQLSIPVSCITDMDVMPDCAPKKLGLVYGDDDPKWNNPKRKWKAIHEFGDSNRTQDQALLDWRNNKQLSDAQKVKTFVADCWTFEYDLAYFGLAKEMFLAANLAVYDEQMNIKKKERKDIETQTQIEFEKIEAEANGDRTILCTSIYQLFHTGDASKTIAAQYLSEILVDQCKQPDFRIEEFIAKLPPYIVNAINYVKRETQIVQPAQDSINEND